MAGRLGDKVAAAFYDNEAIKHTRRALELDKMGDKASTEAKKKKWRRLAQDERAKAIHATLQAIRLDRG